MKLARHERLLWQWVEYNYDWMNVGQEFTSYEEYLEGQVDHYEKCSRAKYRTEQIGYSEADLLDNLQTTVNEQAAEIERLKLLLKVQKKASNEGDFFYFEDRNGNIVKMEIDNDDYCQEKENE